MRAAVSLIYFKCSDCGANVRAEPGSTGQSVPCPRCGHQLVCPPVSPPRSRPPVVATRIAGLNLSGSSVLRVWLALLIAAVAWGAWSVSRAPDGAPVGDAPPQSAADERQFEILQDAITLPPDPTLVELYGVLNSRHFHGLLPAVPVVWEPRLSEVGELADDAFSLEGMFGHIGDRAIVLLNPDLARNNEATLRALSHEMVHVWLYTIGEPSTGHGPAFQMALKRLADEGAFSGLAATDQERETLRVWLDAESSRLDSMGAQARLESNALEREARDLERDLSVLSSRGVVAGDPDAAAWRHRRDAYNRRAQQLRDRATRHERDVAAFNAQVERYNLMAAYPSGLDDE